MKHLDTSSAADLLFTLGTLAGCICSTGKAQLQSARSGKSQKTAEGLLNASIAFFELLGLSTRAAEARIELSRCYYREGLFDVAREVLSLAISSLSQDQLELRSLCLVLLAAVDRDAGYLNDSLTRLDEAKQGNTKGQLITGRYHHELATTLKELAVANSDSSYAEQARESFAIALYEFESIGNHRYVAAAKNNLGYLLLDLGELKESEAHLQEALSLFGSFDDGVRVAQVSETLARLYLATDQYESALSLVEQAVAILETSDGEALLAEALTTKALINCRLDRWQEAVRVFESAYRVAERCGDIEGAVRALVTKVEEMFDYLNRDELIEICARLRVFVLPPQSSLSNRVQALKQRLGQIQGS